MTLHITYDHQCPKCQVFYIPYDDQVPCPNCGLIELERIDYIEQAADSMRFNKVDGSYTPGAWYVGSLGDHILMLLFPLFDAYEEEHPDDFQVFATDRIGKMDWGDQLYLKDHVFGIAVRLHETLKLDDSWNTELRG
jgi:hypothetical protein